MWIRTVNVDAKWDCHSNTGYISKPHLVKVRITDEYKDKPTESINTWASRVGDEVTQKMCEKACQSLSDSVFCNEIFPDIGTPTEISTVPRIPETALSLYRELQSEISREKSRIARSEDEMADIFASTPREELTSAQKGQIRDLANEIRRSESIIREDERDIKTLEKDYPDIREYI